MERKNPYENNGNSSTLPLQRPHAMPAAEGHYHGHPYPSPMAAAPFPGMAGARPVSAGRQIGFELLGYIVFALPLMVLYAIVILALVLFAMDDLKTHNTVSFDQGIGIVLQYMLFALLSFVIEAGIYYFGLAVLLKCRGRTPGGVLGRYKTVDAETGQYLSLGRAVGYYAVYLLLLGILFFLPIFVWLLPNALQGLIYFCLFFLPIFIWLSPLFDSGSGWCRGWPHRMVGGVAVQER